jgi:hypothetical protein
MSVGLPEYLRLQRENRTLRQQLRKARAAAVKDDASIEMIAVALVLKLGGSVTFTAEDVQRAAGYEIEDQYGTDTAVLRVVPKAAT